MRKTVRLLVHRVVICAALILLQLTALIVFIFQLRDYFIYYQTASLLLGTVCSLRIMNNDSHIAYKIAWIFVILVFPVFGAMFYLIFGKHSISDRKKEKMSMITEEQMQLCMSEYNKNVEIEDDAGGNKQAYYLKTCAYSPLYENTYTQYLKSGEKKLDVLIDELRRAKKYIFLEYFIIRKGDMWGRVLDILREKASQGVDVRIIYDDFGCITSLPKHYPDEMRKYGIKCCVFNRLKPVLSPRLNNRDHRKICVIDGAVGFTGGVNFSDEYINKRIRCGHWKDTAVMIKGEAVFSLTVMFLGMWEYITSESVSLSDYYPDEMLLRPHRGKPGYVQPYSDSPIDSEPVGQNVYLNMISAARKYLYITTPYLIIDNEMTSALCNAAKTGVDVRIITPGIPDKKFIFQITRSNYKELLKSGVRIFEYSPGFIHSKMFVCDDKYATVGTVNLDYRSLFLHFECGIWMCNTESVADIRDDILQTLLICEEIPADFVQNKSAIKRLSYSVIRIFAPLL